MGRQAPAGSLALGCSRIALGAAVAATRYPPDGIRGEFRPAATRSAT